jgi:hypothetical protein
MVVPEVAVNDLKIVMIKPRMGGFDPCMKAMENQQQSDNRRKRIPVTMQGNLT